MLYLKSAISEKNKDSLILHIKGLNSKSMPKNKKK